MTTGDPVPQSEFERVTARGWDFTLRYVFLCRATAPASRIGKWLLAIATVGAVYLTTGEPNFESIWP